MIEDKKKIQKLTNNGITIEEMNCGNNSLSPFTA